MITTLSDNLKDKFVWSHAIIGLVFKMIKEILLNNFELDHENSLLLSLRVDKNKAFDASTMLIDYTYTVPWNKKLLQDTAFVFVDRKDLKLYVFATLSSDFL